MYSTYKITPFLLNFVHLFIFCYKGLYVKKQMKKVKSVTYKKRNLLLQRIFFDTRHFD